VARRPPTRGLPVRPRPLIYSETEFFTHGEAEWGTKRTCPKCATRFYDLGKDDPVNCISCGVSWFPEPVLKSKQPLPFEAAKVEVEVEKEDADLAADDLDIDVDAEAEENPDDEVDLGGDDDIGVPGAADDEEEV
jgi:uncharacterized protein (TIGR02300 family)